MITTIIILLFLMIGQGVVRRNHHIQEQPITFSTWLGTFITYWLAIIYGLLQNVIDAVVSKKSLAERYMTIKEQEEYIKDILKESNNKEDEN